jgi:cell division protein FtsN
MARDYKHRVQSNSYTNSRSRRPKKAPNMIWRWLLVAVLIASFVFFLNMISKMVPELIGNKTETANQPTTEKAKPEPSGKTQTTAEPEKKATASTEIEEPRYDFYTILPQAEVVVPDYEIKSRVREELVGKSKAVKYIMQAGSFRDANEANQHKAKLALLGIEARVEKAKVGNVIWHRIKIGPYDNSSSVSTIKDLLQKNGIGVIVTESGHEPPIKP